MIESDKTHWSAYKKGKIVLLALGGSLGGFCMGYNTCVVAGALFKIENDFPHTTIEQKEVHLHFLWLSLDLVLC